PRPFRRPPSPTPSRRRSPPSRGSLPPTSAGQGPMKVTALHSRHRELGARMVPFAGWEMPVQYTGILDEAAHVRAHAGLFDLGHMGRVRVTGPDAEAFLQRLQTNDAAQIPPGAIRYSMLLDAGGLIQDDILVYRQVDDRGFFLV